VKRFLGNERAARRAVAQARRMQAHSGTRQSANWDRRPVSRWLLADGLPRVHNKGTK